jgi:gamma-glutamylcyclotransferase
LESWYFAYGSNLCMEQMISRTGAIGHAERGARIVRLANHRLLFQQIDPTGPAFANIKTPGEGVLGVVYRCSPAELERLDHFEAGYRRKLITVSDRHGEVLVAVAYVMRPESTANSGQPHSDYLDRIVTGARRHGLPDDYIGNLVSIASGVPPATAA